MIPAAFIGGWLLQARLYGVAAHDPAVLVAGVVLLLLAAAVAALLPAARAARLDP